MSTLLRMTNNCVICLHKPHVLNGFSCKFKGYLQRKKLLWFIDYVWLNVEWTAYSTIPIGNFELNVLTSESDFYALPNKHIHCFSMLWVIDSKLFYSRLYEVTFNLFIFLNRILKARQNWPQTVILSAIYFEFSLKGQSTWLSEVLVILCYRSER